jgi:hypothetical protein
MRRQVRAKTKNVFTAVGKTVTFTDVDFDWIFNSRQSCGMSPRLVSCSKLTGSMGAVRA